MLRLAHATGPDIFDYDEPGGPGSERIILSTTWFRNRPDGSGALLRFYLVRTARRTPRHHILRDPVTPAVLWVLTTKYQEIRDFVAARALPNLLRRLPDAGWIGDCFRYMLRGSETGQPQSLEAIQSAYRELMGVAVGNS